MTSNLTVSGDAALKQGDWCLTRDCFGESPKVVGGLLRFAMLKA